MILLKKHVLPILSLSWPIMLGQAGHMITGIADTAMVGELGHVPLAGLSFVQNLFLIFMVFGIGYSMGLTPLVSDAHGGNNHSTIHKIYQNGLISFLLLATILVLALLGIFPFLDYFGQEAEVIEAAKPYYIWFALSLFPQIGYIFYKQFAEGLSLTRMAMVVSILGNVLNVILNYGMIYGNLGMPEMGLEGAAIATFIARSAMFGAMIAYAYYHKEIAHYTAIKWADIQLFWQKKIVKMGIPVGLQFVFEAGAFSISAIMMGWFGSEPLAAHQIALMIAATTYLLASGLSGGIAIRIGNAFGQKNNMLLKEIAFSGINLVLLFMLACAATLILFKSVLPTLFNDNPLVLEYASVFLILAAFFQLFDGLQLVCNSVLRGIQDVNIPTLIGFTSYWLIAMPAAYCFSQFTTLGVRGIWVGLLIGLGITGVILFIRLKKLLKVKHP